MENVTSNAPQAPACVPQAKQGKPWGPSSPGGRGSGDRRFLDGRVPFILQLAHSSGVCLAGRPALRGIPCRGLRRCPGCQTWARCQQRRWHQRPPPPAPHKQGRQPDLGTGSVAILDGLAEPAEWLGRLGTETPASGWTSRRSRGGSASTASAFKRCSSAVLVTGGCPGSNANAAWPAEPAGLAATASASACACSRAQRAGARSPLCAARAAPGSACSESLTPKRVRSEPASATLQPQSPHLERFDRLPLHLLHWAVGALTGGQGAQGGREVRQAAGGEEGGNAQQVPQVRCVAIAQPQW